MITIYNYKKQKNYIKICTEFWIFNLKITKITDCTFDKIKITGKRIPNWATINHPEINVRFIDFSICNKELTIGFYVNKIYINNKKISIEL